MDKLKGFFGKKKNNSEAEALLLQRAMQANLAGSKYFEKLSESYLSGGYDLNIP